jgi:hypothetical protein
MIEQLMAIYGAIILTSYKAVPGTISSIALAMIAQKRRFFRAAR